ncbi:MAG: DctP family TRAP transporter solute-binding subunit [Desulfuromonadales bacterium]|nr:DctP family TRAP transporter solute-binding subunit [Desulfuromonadales bacterium]
MRFLSFLTIAVLIASVMAPAAHAAEPILIRFSHVTSENSPKGQGAVMFKRLAEERLAGKVKVKIYPNSQKFDDNQAPLGLLFGDIEMAAPSLSKFRAYSRKMQVFDLPFLFSDIDALHRFQQGSAGKSLLDSMITQGIKGLAYWDNGPRVISARRAIKQPADAKRLVFRIEASAVFQEQYARVGAVGIQMPFKRLPDAMKEGLISAQENAWSNIRSMQVHKFHNHFTELGHSFLGYMVVTSAAFWNGLPADVRTQLEAILKEVTDKVNALAAEQALSARQEVLQSGAKLVEPSEADRRAWHDALTPVWKRFENEIGSDLISAARASN